MENTYEHLGRSTKLRSSRNLMTRYTIKLIFATAFIVIAYLIAVASEAIWNPFYWSSVGITIFTFTSLLIVINIVADKG